MHVLLLTNNHFPYVLLVYIVIIVIMRTELRYFYDSTMRVYDGVMMPYTTAIKRHTDGITCPIANIRSVVGAIGVYTLFYAPYQCDLLGHVAWKYRGSMTLISDNV